MLSHGRKGRLEIAFVTGGQHFQALIQSLGCGRNVRYVRLEVRIARISKQRDRVDVRQKLMQQLHTLWSQDCEENGNTGEVAARST